MASSDLERLTADLAEAWRRFPADAKAEGQRAIDMGYRQPGVIAFPDATGVTYRWAGYVLLRTTFRAEGLDPQDDSP